MRGQHVLTVARWAGLFPFDHHGYYNSKWATYSFFAVITYVLIHLYKWVTYIIIVNRSKLHYLQSSINTLLLLMSMLCFTSHFDVIMRNRDEFSFLIDLALHSAPSPISDMCFLLFALFIVGAVQVMATLLSMSIKDTSYKITLVGNFNLIIPLIILLQYTSILKLLRHEFSQVKGSINVDKHEKLVFLANRIDLLFGRQLLMFLVSVLINLIVTAYNLVFTIYDQNYGSMFFCDSVFIALFLAEILYLCETCSSTISEAESFNHELFRMMRANDLLCTNKKLHLYVTMKQTVEFTACGFFKLGYPLVTSIIAAATTYLVILVQFSLKSPD